MEKKYGVMVIGCGHIGEEHLADIYYRDNVRIEAVVDNRPERAADCAGKYRARRHGTDYRSFLDNKQAGIDIVIIATYADSHLAILKDCLSAGKHVLCEKPIADTLEKTKQFCKLVRDAERKVLVAHILRHNRSYQRLAELIQGDAVGNLRLIRMVQNHHALDWDRYRRLMEDCPPIVDCGVHYLDVMHWFTGSRIEAIQGMGCPLDEENLHNYGVIEARLQNGCIGYYEAGWSRNLGAENKKEFIGDKGRLTLTLQENRADNREEGDLITLYRSDTGEYRSINVRSKYKDMYAQLLALIRMIENDASAVPSIEEAYAAFEAAYAAAAHLNEGFVLLHREDDVFVKNREYRVG